MGTLMPKACNVNASMRAFPVAATPLIPASPFIGSSAPAPVASIQGDALQLRLTVSQAALQFCQATLEKKHGCDEKAIQRICQAVHQQGLQQEFETRVEEQANSLGYPTLTVPEILEKKILHNPLLKPFKQADYKECLDYWQNGRNTFQVSPTEYRLSGMLRSFTDFFGMIKKNPAASVGVIGTVAYVGHKKPLLGALAGLAILVSSATSAVRNEIKARQIPEMNERKAECYRNSGESFMAFLLTLTGADGIYQGAMNGMKTFSQVAPEVQQATQLPSMFLRAKNAILAEMPVGHDMSPFTAFRFVLGLFDEALMPSNWVAGKLRAGTQSKRPISK